MRARRGGVLPGFLGALAGAALLPVILTLLTYVGVRAFDPQATQDGQYAMVYVLPVLGGIVLGAYFGSRIAQGGR